MINKIKKLRMQAMKSRNQLAKDLWTTLLGEIQLASSKKDLTDDQVLKIVQKFRASCNENFVAHGIESAGEEVKLLDSILPVMMSRDDLKSAIEKLIESGTVSIGDHIGKATGMVIKNLKQQKINFNGGEVKSILEELMGD